MSDPVYAADVLADILDTLNGPLGANIEPEQVVPVVDALRRACGWDGEGDPPVVVIGTDGRLMEFFPAMCARPYPVCYEAVEGGDPDGGHALDCAVGNFDGSVCDCGAVQ